MAFLMITYQHFLVVNHSHTIKYILLQLCDQSFTVLQITHALAFELLNLKQQLRKLWKTKRVFSYLCTLLSLKLFFHQSLLLQKVIELKRAHRFSVTLSFTPKHSSDEHLGVKLRVTENRWVLFNSLTYVYLALLPQHWALYAKVDSTPTFLYIHIYKYIFYDHLKKSLLPAAQPTEPQDSDENAKLAGNWHAQVKLPANVLCWTPSVRN